MHKRPHHKLTREQKESLYSVYMRDVTPFSQSYMNFRRTVLYDAMFGCVMVPLRNIWLGIEKDGHIHS